MTRHAAIKEPADLYSFRDLRFTRKKIAANTIMKIMPSRQLILLSGPIFLTSRAACLRESQQ
jgi:hypothetical protein